jgi:hypothetical protein
VAAIDNNELGWYRILVKLYPKAYRQEYEEEMLTTLQEMLSSAESSTEKRQLFFRTLKDYFLSLTQQSLLATENSFNDAPGYVKRDISISSCLVAPFFLIFAYNVTSLYFHHAVILFGNLEAKTWIIYSIVLPLFALVLSVKTCLSGVYGQLLRHQWRKAIDIVFQDWLFLGVIVASLALVAIF